MIAGFFTVLSVSCFGQQERQPKPSWLSTKGYWVVEGNVNAPLQHTVRFYNNDNLLIGIKELGGTKLNISKRKVKMMLKQNLDASLLAWEQQKAKSTQSGIAITTP